MTFEQLLVLEPCEDALAFVESCGSVAKAWKECERGDWMFWLLRHIPTRETAQRVLLIGPLLLQRIPPTLESLYYAERARGWVERANKLEGWDSSSVLLRLSMAASFAVESRTDAFSQKRELKAQAEDLRRLLPPDFLEEK